MTGRRQQPARARRTSVWETGDDLQMLACLDFQVQDLKAKARPHIKDRILSHLKANRQKDFTVAQVEQRLKELQDQFIPKHLKQSIYNRGTKGFSQRYPAVHKRRIARIRESLHTEHVASGRRSSQRILRSTSHGWDTRSSRTSSPRVEIRLPPPGSALRGITGAKRPHGASKQESCEQVAIPQTPTIEKCDEDNDLTSSPYVRLDVVPDSVTQSSDMDADEIHMLDQHLLSPPGRTDLHSHHACEETATRAMLLVRELNDMKDRVQSLCVLERQTQAELDVVKKEIQALRNQATSQQSLHTVNVSLHKELSRFQKRCEELANTLRCQEYALAEAPTARTLTDLTNENDKLKNLLEKRKSNAIFLQLKDQHHYGPSRSAIEQQMSIIGHLTKQTLYAFAYDDTHTLIIPDFKAHSDLLSLSLRSLGLEPRDTVDLERIPIDLAGIGLQAIICALISAALCEWVFANEFELTASGASVVLDMYRKFILEMNDQLALRNVDIAAHKAFFTSEYYHNHVVPARATDLANRLSRALAPLIPATVKTNNDADNTLNSFHTWGEEVSVWKSRQALFIEIFTLALLLKGSLLTSTDRYEMVLYSYGTPFSEDHMNAETINGDQAEPAANHTVPVQLCLLPAIYTYPCENQSLVQYPIPVTSNHDDQAHRHILTRAVVICNI